MVNVIGVKKHHESPVLPRRLRVASLAQPPSCEEGIHHFEAQTMA